MFLRQEELSPLSRKTKVNVKSRQQIELWHPELRKSRRHAESKETDK